MAIVAANRSVDCRAESGRNGAVLKVERASLGSRVAVARRRACRQARVRSRSSTLIYNGCMSVRDLIIVGAGPSGLSAAIAAKQRGLDYQVLEQGVLVNSIYRFPPQMVFFTTPELLEIGGLPFVSPYEKPTRAEALRYYRGSSTRTTCRSPSTRTVLSIEREPDEARGRRSRRVFAVETRSSRGVRRVRHARNVVLAIGYYDQPNMLSVPGEDLPHVQPLLQRAAPLLSPARGRRRRRQLGGRSRRSRCIRAGAHVTLVHRRPELKSTIKYWVRPDIENRIKEGSIAARFNTCVTRSGRRRSSVRTRSGRRGRGDCRPTPCSC